MFPQVVVVTSRGRRYEYLRLLESYRDEKGVSKHRVVVNLGRVDQLEGKLDSLVASLSKYTEAPLVTPRELRSEAAVPWGPVLLARHLYDQLDLGGIIRRHCGGQRRRFDVGETAFVLLVNRLTDPRSEHGLARWLENYYVCDASGERWEPEWLPEEAITPAQRVRVKPVQLNRWYRTLDALLAAKGEIEQALYLQVRDLFSLEVDMVLYDITSTYFQRRSPKGTLRRHGKSRDGKGRNVQIVLGVVLANGFPIAHHVFPGHTADKTTLTEVVTDLEERLGLRRVLFVGDRGFVSEANLSFLGEAAPERRYLLGIPGRRNRESAQVLEQVRPDAWQPVDASNRVQAVETESSDVRYFVVESEERQTYEQALRQRSMQRVLERLEKLKTRVQAGRLKDPAKIGAAAERALSKDHGHRYYSYEVPAPGSFRFWVDEDKLAAETRREGCYVLKTNDLSLTPPESVGLYKQLSEVEWAYRDLKDVLAMRPIYHKSDDRVEAHILVATLALFLKRTLEHQLTQKNVLLTPTEAFAAMHSIGIDLVQFKGGQRHLVSGGGRDARRILKALGITQLLPPGAE
jgi:transposase